MLFIIFIKSSGAQPSLIALKIIEWLWYELVSLDVNNKEKAGFCYFKKIHILLFCSESTHVLKLFSIAWVQQSCSLLCFSLPIALIASFANWREWEISKTRHLKDLGIPSLLPQMSSLNLIYWCSWPIFLLRIKYTAYLFSESNILIKERSLWI